MPISTKSCKDAVQCKPNNTLGNLVTRKYAFLTYLVNINPHLKLDTSFPISMGSDGSDAIAILYAPLLTYIEP